MSLPRRVSAWGLALALAGMLNLAVTFSSDDHGSFGLFGLLLLAIGVYKILQDWFRKPKT